MIKAAVDFRGVEVLRDQRQRIKLGAGAVRIDPPAPIGIRPTGRTDVDVSEGAHARDFVRQV